MAHRLVILTGASRGLGAALAEQLLTHDTHLLCVARGRHPDLARRAAGAGASLEEWSRDLSDSVSVAQRRRTLAERARPAAVRPGGADQQRRRDSSRRSD